MNSEVFIGELSLLLRRRYFPWIQSGMTVKIALSEEELSIFMHTSWSRPATAVPLIFTIIWPTCRLDRAAELPGTTSATCGFPSSTVRIVNPNLPLRLRSEISSGVCWSCSAEGVQNCAVCDESRRQGDWPSSPITVRATTSRTLPVTAASLTRLMAPVCEVDGPIGAPLIASTRSSGQSSESSAGEPARIWFTITDTSLATRGGPRGKIAYGCACLRVGGGRFISNWVETQLLFKSVFAN